MSATPAQGWPQRARSQLPAVLFVLALAAVAALSAAGVTELQHTKYRSSVVLVVAPIGARTDNEALVRTVEALAVSRPLAEDLRQRAGLPLSGAAVQRRLRVTRPPDSSVLTISVSDRSRTTSQRLARQLTPALAARVVDFGPATPTAANPAPYRLVPITGNPETEVIKPPLRRNAAIGLGLGLLLGVGLVSLRIRSRLAMSPQGPPLSPPEGNPVWRPSPHPRPHPGSVDGPVIPRPVGR